MKQMVLQAAGKIEIIEAEMPRREPGEVLLKTLYGGICGSDLSSYRGVMKYITYPEVPGHEFSAEIVEIEEDNQFGLKKGMIVTANPYFNCGTCYSCKKGLVNCCSTNKTMGIQKSGAFSEFFTLPIERVYAGEGLSAKTLALVEPFCISHHGIKRANIKKGDNVLVIGAGTIGICAVLAAQTYGAVVTIADVSTEKLEFAKGFNVDHTILSNDTFMDQVMKITNGDGYDVVVEAVGLPATFQNCIEAASFGGTMIQIGVGKSNVDLFFTKIQQKEMAIFGSRNAVQSDFQEVIKLLQDGKLNLEDIISKIYPLEESAKAFEDFDQNVGSMLKVMIDFTGSEA